MSVGHNPCADEHGGIPTARLQMLTTSRQHFFSLLRLKRISGLNTAVQSPDFFVRLRLACRTFIRLPLPGQVIFQGFPGFFGVNEHSTGAERHSVVTQVAERR